MDEVEARTQKELTDIIAVLTQQTGLPSRWSGRVELVPDAEFKGRKRQMCDIQIDAALATRDERWPTLIHEALHSISVGYNGTDFRLLRGWEEGVVEQLQRIYRPIFLRQIGVRLEGTVFESGELHHQFNPYIAALESLRHYCEPPKQEIDFYVDLLSLPLKERPDSILRSGFSLERSPRATFMMTYSQANAILTRKTNR